MEVKERKKSEIEGEKNCNDDDDDNKEYEEE